MVLEVVGECTDTMVEEEAERTNESTGPEAALDGRGSLVDNMYQTMESGRVGKLL